MNGGGARLLLTADAVGGVWEYATTLATALLPLGYRPTIALIGPAPDAARRAAVPAGVELVETGLPLDWLADGPGPVRAAAAALADLARGHDLLHLDSPALAADGRFPVPVVAVAHGCLGTWWDAVEGGAVPDAMAWQVDLVGAGLRAADRVAAPTAAFADAVHRRYRLRARPQVVHNGRAAPAAVGAAGPTLVFTAGRLWDRAKATPLLDRVAARLAVPFHAAGPVAGPQGEQVAPRHLALTGPLDAAGMAARLAAQPVFVSAARFEPFGLAVLEAAAAGCPLVLADQPTFRELWEGAALFVPADGEAGYATAIGRLLDDPALHRRLGGAARARAGRFTPAAMAAGMAALYAPLLGRRAAA